MTFALRRRQLLGLMTSGLAATAVFGANGATAAALISTFSQALAAAAQDDAVVAEFYLQRDYATLWTGAADVDRRQRLFDLLDTATSHALPSGRYDSAGLREKFAAVNTEGDVGRLEVAMTRAYLAIVRDLSSGAVVPSKLTADIKREIAHLDPAMVLAAAASEQFGTFIANLSPVAPEYTRLMKEKFALEAVIARGGYGPSVDAESLQLGDSGAAVVQLRDRLVAFGYLGRSFTQDYDQTIADAVQQFQIDHGQTADGIVTERTLAALNTDADQHWRSVVVAMERLRWMGQAPLGSRHIWVNQPDFLVRVVDDGKVTFKSRVVIGKVGDDTESPEFSDMMEYMVVNPTWSVPRSIVVKEYLPMLQRNASAQGQLEVIDQQGRVVPRSAINFAAYTDKTFPFALRQPPSDGNALGLVKFMFPNPYNIYLHDTPSKALFDKEVRAFSHGCIRVGAPFEMAYFLLARQSDDPEGLFKSYLKGGREAVLNFATPIPVHLVYFTAWPNEQGRITYAADVYGRDAKIFEALVTEGLAEPNVQS